MGWNSWNCFGVDVREAQVRAAAEYVAEHLRPHWWEYIVVDAGWYLGEGVTTANFKQARPPKHVDAYGRPLPAPHKFPSSAGGRGFRPLADHVHGLGLKFGVHIMRGIPWTAAERDLPVSGSTLRAGAIADGGDRCPWYQGNYGLRVEGGGALAYYRSLIALFATWGVDFIKADDMGFPFRHGEIEALAQAVQESPRPMVLSLSPGPAPIGEADQLSSCAHLWRISPDFWDDWRLLHRQFSLCRAWQGRSEPGRWPDCDMLPLGKLRLTGPDDYSVAEMGLKAEELTNEYSRLTRDEQLTTMTLWSIFRSPLFLGGYLPENDALTNRLITHTELIALNQHSRDNREVYFDDGLSVWTAESTVHEGRRYFAVFNLRNAGETGAPVVRWRDLGLGGPREAREVWTGERRELRPAADAAAGVPHHGVMLYCLER
jgi:hypothetical protein